MIGGRFGRRGGTHFEPPIELRFVDLFMIIVVTLMFVTVLLSIISAFVGSSRTAIDLKIATRSLPTALVGRPYEVTLAAAGGVAPYTWTIAKGELPAGLELDAANGAIAGTPAAAGRSQLRLTVADAADHSATRELVVEALAAELRPEAEPAMWVSGDVLTLPSGQVGRAFRYHLTANGGVPPYTWAVTSGTLPAGLSLTASGDVIGVPEASQQGQALEIAATDSAGAVIRQPAQMAVEAAPAPIAIDSTGQWPAWMTVGWLFALTWLVFWTAIGRFHEEAWTYASHRWRLAGMLRSGTMYLWVILMALVMFRVAQADLMYLVMGVYLVLTVFFGSLRERR